MEIMNGYKNDLGTGLQTGDEIGCHCLTGLKLSNKNRYQCFIKLGTSPEDKPWIEMFNYEEIQAAAEITIMFTGLTTIADTKWTYTYAGIRVYYKERYGVVQYYDLVNDISEVQVAALAISTSSGIAEQAGSNYVGEFANYTFNFTLTNTIKGSVSTDFIKIIFPNNMFNKEGDVRVPTCSLGTLFIMGVANTIYLQPTTDLTGFISLDLNSLENPQYSMESQTFQVKIQEIVDDQLHNKFTFDLTRKILPAENFSIFSVTVNDSTGGVNNVTYEITVNTGHKIPNEGYLKIEIPQEYGKLSVLGVTCKLENFGEETSCNVNANSIEIFFNGNQFNETLNYKIILYGMNNPNQNMDSKYFNIYSQFSELDPTKVISQSKANAPKITLASISNCQLLINITEQTQAEVTNYNFKFTCSTDIRENSEIIFSLPDNYKTIYEQEIKSTQAQEKIFSCKSDNLYFLRDDQCIMTIEGSILITAKVTAQSAKTPLNIQIFQIKNPSSSGRVTGFYIETKSQNILYAKSQQPALIIISSNDYQISSDVQEIAVRLQNIPISAGQEASYIFSLNAIEKIPTYTFTSVNIYFSDYFQYGISHNLECGVFFTDQNSSVSFDETYELFYNANSKYISLPCTVEEKKVTIANVDTHLKNQNSSYINWVIRNVINPSKQLIHELTIEYSSGTASIYKLTDNFTITLSLSPSELYLSKSPQLTSYNIKNYAYYHYFVKLVEDLPSYDKLGILIKLPNSYREVQSFQNRSNFYCDSSLNPIPGETLECKFYGNNLLIFINSSALCILEKQQNTYSFDIILSEMMNPLIETTCSTTSKSLNSLFQFYEINLINLKNGHIISRNYQANDKQNCVEFVKELYSISIIGERKVYAGFSYVLTIQLEFPYDGIVLIPSIKCTNHRITFNASEIYFNNFITNKQNILINIDQSTQPGSYSIVWTKQETKHQIAFMEVLDTTITVLESNSTKVKPKILIEQINVIGVNMKFDIAVTLEQPAAFIICLNSKFSYSIKQQWLRNIIYSNPKKLCFQIGETKKYFSLYSKMELNSQTMKFSITPLDALKIYNLTETVRTIYIEDKPSKEKCHIFSVSSNEISKNHAYLHALVSEQSKVSFILSYRNSIEPTEAQLIAFNYNYAIQQGINHTILPTKMLEQASTEINLLNLEANTKYTLFCIARGRHTYSQIYKYYFETKQLSNAVLLRFQLNSQIIPNATITKAFASTLCTYQERFLIIDINNFDKPINSSIMNERPAIYEMLIVPNSTNDEQTPIELAKMLNNQIFKQKLKKTLNSIKENFEITYREYLIDELKVAEEPKMVLVTYYNATISMRFWKKAKVYAVRLCEKKGENQLLRQKVPLSQQIYKGFDQLNNKLNLTQYYYFEGITDYYGSILIFFDDLKPERECTVYITAGTYVPFNPPHLMDDDQVRSITFSTPKNKNLGN